MYNPIYDPDVLRSLPAATETASRAYLIEYGENISADANPAPRIERQPVEAAPSDPDEVLIESKAVRPANGGKLSANRVPPPDTVSRVVDDVSRIQPPPGVTPIVRADTVPAIAVDPPAPQPIHRVPPPPGLNTGGATPTIASGHGRVFSFLANPETIDYTSGQASYSEVTGHASRRSHLHYSHTTNETWKLSNLLLDTWCEGKHVKPILDGARALMEADVSKGNYEPPTMEFVMGQRRSGPCKITSVSWKETRWLDGLPAGVRLSLELKRIPFPTRSQNYLDLPAISESSGLLENLALTDRQMEDARTAARLYLEDNLSNYAPSVQELVRSGAYTLTPGTDGVVEMHDDAGNVIGVVGQWDGRELRVTGVNSVPTADPVEESETAADLAEVVTRPIDPLDPEKFPTSDRVKFDSVNFLQDNQHLWPTWNEDLPGIDAALAASNLAGNFEFDLERVQADDIGTYVVAVSVVGEGGEKFPIGVWVDGRVVPM